MIAAADERSWIRDAATLPPLEYDRVRAGLAELLGVRVATLDGEVNAQRPRRNGTAPHESRVDAARRRISALFAAEALAAEARHAAAVRRVAAFIAGPRRAPIQPGRSRRPEVGS